MKSFYRILRYTKPYLSFGILNITFNILTVIFSLFSFTMVIPFLGLLFETINPNEIKTPQSFSLTPNSIKDHFYYQLKLIIEDGSKIDALIFICSLILITFFLRNLFRYLALYFLTPIRNGVVHDLRIDLYKKLISFPISFLTKRKKGDIMSRMTNDLVEIEWSIMSSLEMIFRDPIQIIFYLITLTIISKWLTLFAIILFPIAGFMIAKIGKSLKKSSKKSQSKMGDILSIIDETIRGLKIIKSFNAEGHVQRKFEKESNKYKSLMTSLLRKKDLSSPMSEFLSTIVLVIVMLVGGYLVLNQDLSMSLRLYPEEFIGYVLIFSQIIPPVRSFTTAYYHLQKGSAAAIRIDELLNKNTEISNHPNSINLKKIKKNIHLKNVSFKYENQDILKNINFKIDKGKTVALVGKSGSGKSTIADLCARFYEIKKGEICVDRINIKDIKLTNLRQLIGIVSQESILFNDSIYNNLLIGNPLAKREEVIQAAKIANAHEFIMRTDEKYNTNIGERGDKLSGGEKQRMSIARAILKNPEFLILDEATSSLDTNSEKLVQQALKKLMKSRTSLVIAHRLSTIQHADEIIVLDNGEIVEHGTHEELIAKNQHYKSLIDLQKFN